MADTHFTSYLKVCVKSETILEIRMIYFFKQQYLNLKF